MGQLQAMTHLFRAATLGAAFLGMALAAAPAHGRLAAGLEDGRVWWADPAGRGLQFVKQDKGAPITALAMSSGAASIAWADEDGQAGVASL